MPLKTQHASVKSKNIQVVRATGHEAQAGMYGKAAEVGIGVRDIAFREGADIAKREGEKAAKMKPFDRAAIEVTLDNNGKQIVLRDDQSAVMPTNLPGG